MNIPQFNDVQAKLLVLLGWMVTPILLLNWINFPAGDDFSFANTVEQLGFWRSQVVTYLEWTGRYVANALFFSGPTVWRSFGWYRIFSLLNQLLLLVALAFFLRRLLETLQLHMYFWIVYSAFVAIFFVGMPSLAEGLYWQIGYVQYTVAFSAFLVILGWQLQRFFLGGMSRAAALMTFLLMIYIGGSTEILMFQLSLLFLALSIFSFRKRTDLKKRADLVKNLIFLGVIGLAGLINAVAPGNQVRKSMFTPQNPFYGVFKAFFSGGIERTLHFINLPMVLAFLLVIYWVAHGQRSWPEWLKRTRPWKSLLLIWFILAMGFFPSQVGMGGNPPDRGRNLLYAEFMILMALWAIHLAVAYQGWWQSVFARRIWLQPRMLFVALLASTVFWPNSFTAWRDLFNSPTYKAALDQRLELLTGAAGKNIVFTPLPYWPKTVLIYDLSPSREEWINAAFATYFKLRSVEVHDK